jgi:hypothetical protein
MIARRLTIHEVLMLVPLSTERTEAPSFLRCISCRLRGGSVRRGGSPLYDMKGHLETKYYTAAVNHVLSCFFKMT